MRDVLTILWAVFAVATSTVYAATPVGKVTAAATKYGDEQGAGCCNRVVPDDASSELTKACEAKGGTYYKNAKFSDSAYCGTQTASPGKGWRFQCSKAVEADCYK